jgi:exonuclease VII large subunit
VVDRGYSIVTKGKKVITSYQQIGVGDELALQLGAGEAVVQVQKVLPPKSNGNSE